MQASLSKALHRISYQIIPFYTQVTVKVLGPLALQFHAIPHYIQLIVKIHKTKI